MRNRSKLWSFEFGRALSSLPLVAMAHGTPVITSNTSSLPEVMGKAAVLEQILAPALRSRNPERRKEAVEALENLAAIASHLKHLLLVRDLRKIIR